MANEKTPSLMEMLSAIQMQLDKLPTSAQPHELAAVIGMVPDVEKAVRKLKTKWTAALVTGAAQKSLGV